VPAPRATCAPLEPRGASAISGRGAWRVRPRQDPRGR
jgi:hypothetical protein